MKIIFFGTPDFAASMLVHLIEQGHHQIVGVVSKPDKPHGRNLQLQPTPVKIAAQAHIPDVPLFQPQKVSSPEMVEALKSLKADLFVVVAYGEIVKPMILNIPKHGCINVHASILPKYRGAAPMQRALMDGVKEAGVTIMRMDQGLDSGDVLLIDRFVVGSDMNMATFSQNMLQAAKNALCQGLQSIENGSAIFVPQDANQMTLAPKILSQDLLLTPVNSRAESLHNKIRALSPRPGAYLLIYVKGEKKRLKVLKTRVIPKLSLNTFSSLQLVSEKEGLRLVLPEDSISDLLLLKVQLEGKKEMDALEFSRGFPPQDLMMTETL